VPNTKIPLSQLSVAIESAVEQALGKKGIGPIDQLWVGFVAPDTVATMENAQKVATLVSHESGIHVQAANAQSAAPAAGAVHTAALTNPHHILGFVYSPKAAAK